MESKISDDLIVVRRDGERVYVPYQSPVDLDDMIAALEEIRDLVINRRPDGTSESLVVTSPDPA
jgi:hypothetical protein